MTRTDHPKPATIEKRWRDALAAFMRCGESSEGAHFWEDYDDACGVAEELMAEPFSEPVNARLLAALKATTEALAQSYIEATAADADPRVIAGRAAIAEAEAQPQPDRPSYDELLEEIAATIEWIETGTFDGVSFDALRMADALRDLLARAGR